MIMKFEARDFGYTLISKFEKALRGRISTEFEANENDGMELVPQGVKIAAIKRIENIEELDELLENIDFIHLKEIIIYANNYELFFDSKNFKKDNFIKLMDSIYDLRCKIAHIRGYFTNTDLNNLCNEIKTISLKMKRFNKDYLLFMDNFLKNPEEMVVKIPINFYSDECTNYPILNNLPVADYEYEGGFVGREEDKDKIIKMIKSGSHKVITIAGAGGVGKSALALNIVNEIIKNDIIHFDCVIWVSAKENKLTYLGIEDIDPTLKNYEELLDTILNVMEFDLSEYRTIEKKENDIKSLFDICDKILLVIDNLETITDDRIINFILDPHPNLNILITSRRGLGQVERRYDLKELKEKEAIILFRLICKEKNLKFLMNIDNNTIKDYVNKVYCYPLAIKWVLGQIAIGKDFKTVIENINEKSSDISQFCFEQIYTDLSKESKQVLCTLSLYEAPMPKGILKYISNLSDDVFEDSVQVLTRLSLIIPEQFLNKQNQEINAYFSILPLTRGYIKAQLDKDQDIKIQLQNRMLTVENTIEEAERAKKQYRYSLSNLGAITEEEKVASMLAQAAYQKYQAGSYIEAVESYKKAVDIAPRFASIYRNWAIMESYEMHWVEADKLMGKAARLSPNDTQIWLSWGNMKRKTNKIKEAMQYYSKAHELSPKDNVVLNSYAQAISRLGDYKRADALFQEALNLGEDNPHNKHLIINYTSIAENYKRWTESLIEDRDYNTAEKMILKAYYDINKVIKLDHKDKKSNILLREILFTISYIKKIKEEYDESEKYLKEIINLPYQRFKEIEFNTRAHLELIELYLKQEKIIQARKYYTKELEKNVKIVNKPTIYEKYNRIQKKFADIDSYVYGRIIRCNVDRKFIIIEKENCDGDTYLSLLNMFNEYVELNDSLINRKVKFIPEQDNGKKIATKVTLI